MLISALIINRFIFIVKDFRQKSVITIVQKFKSDSFLTAINISGEAIVSTDRRIMNDLFVCFFGIFKRWIFLILAHHEYLVRNGETNILLIIYPSSEAALHNMVNCGTVDELYYPRAFAESLGLLCQHSLQDNSENHTWL